MQIRKKEENKMASAGRILIMPKDDYNAETTYEMLDLVKHNGKSWLAKKTSVGIEPSEVNKEYWQDMFDIDAVVDEKISSLTEKWTYPTLNDNFKVYEIGASEVRYKKIGNVVYIRGAVSPTTEIASDSVTTIFNIPSAYRPKDLNVNGIMQGTGMNRWCLSITTGGNVNVQRYGMVDNENIPVGVWLNIDISYPLG